MNPRLSVESQLALKLLRSRPMNSPKGMTHFAMYEGGLDHCIAANAEEGCAVFNSMTPEYRQATSAAALFRSFSDQDRLYMLAAAVDRLSELALEGYPVYRRQE